ncbi:MAG: nickel-dependent hydrogenase large subunit [Burkholderiaceae bacterium]|nr:nickel-dependent hydrogenase large subunit [Burkholderiaceae bacterium]
MDLFGARSVHPVGVRIGGFHGAPALSRIEEMREKLRAALPEAEALIRWAASIAVPQDDQAFVSVATRHSTDYAIETGDIACQRRALLSERDAFDEHFAEQHVPHSTALFSTYHQQPYLVGPLARLNLNHDRLPEPVKLLLAESGLVLPSRNLFHSLLARAVEILLALHEALRLLDAYRVPDSPWVPVTPRAGVATGCTEAPRGLLWHRYEMDADGRVVNARIVPPTSQNQGRIEEDLRLSLLNFGLDHPDDALRLHCEKVIRNYDPCISCATHFLRMHVERGHEPGAHPRHRLALGRRPGRLADGRCLAGRRHSDARCESSSKAGSSRRQSDSPAGKRIPGHSGRCHAGQRPARRDTAFRSAGLAGLWPRIIEPWLRCAGCAVACA